MDTPLAHAPRLARKPSSLPPALSPVLKTLGLEEDDPEDVFEIHSKEGAGAFGRVFRASYRRDPTRLAALKVIPVALEAGQRGEDIENVRKEIQFLRECDHPNVVAFYGAYYKDHALWVAMEYCGGGSVGDVSRRRKLDELETAVIMRGALHGLAYLHARKKIHRDIKGGNILLTSEGDVKIADFGVSAQLKDTLSRRGTFVGTPYWMSPEMIQDSDYDYKSDIWSLGITLIELADQRPPLFDEHPMRVLIQIPRNPPPSVKEPWAWTPLLVAFLQFCLRKDPKERPSAVECLDHAFITRVCERPFVFADRSVVVKGETVSVDDEKGSVAEASVMTTARTMGSLTANASDSEAMADDVTLKARPPKPTALAKPPTMVVPDVAEAVANQSDSLEFERQIISTEPSKNDESAGEADASLATPRESIVEDIGDLSIVRTPSPSSSRSDDEHESDAAAEGFAFRQGPHPPPSSSSSPACGAAASPIVKPLSLPLSTDMALGDDLLQLSVDDDSFEMPAMALISKIQVAALTLAGNSPRPRPPLPLPLPTAASPHPKASRRASAEDPCVLPSPVWSTEPVLVPPRPAVVVVRRDLNAFSRSDSLPRDGSGLAVVHADTSDNWKNPLAQLTTTTTKSSPSHDRVHALLSSLSASTTTRLLAPPSLPSSGDTTPTDLRASLSLRGSKQACASPLSSMEATSSTHFIGSPFRVSHQLNVRYNTVDARYEGVPTSTNTNGSTDEWTAIHTQFGLPLAQMRCRSSTNATTDHHANVPVLVHMLRRELLQRDGLECKYIYRVSPDQSEIQRAKQAIQSGRFDAASVSDPHVFASLLKIWLRDLPTPLLGVLSRDDLASFVSSLVKPEEDERDDNKDAARVIAFTKPFADVHACVTTTLLERLPLSERAVLLWLVDHMLEVMAQSTRNAMTAQSLAVVVAPNVFRWASTTPQDASAIAKQVATLLQVLLAWRQRCRGGREDDAVAEDEVRLGSVRSKPGKTEASVATAREGYDGRSSSISLRDSLNGLRASLHFMDKSPHSRDSTVTSILRRSSLPVAMASLTHFVSASSSDGNGPPTETNAESSRVPLETLLRDCVDGLWNGLPLSILLDEPPPIVHALQKTFQRNVLTLIQANGRRVQERRWATELLGRLGEKARTLHAAKDGKLPLSLRVFTRWLDAALDFEAFTRLLQQERRARERLEKQWPSHASTKSVIASEFTAGRAFAMAEILVLAAIDQRNNIKQTDGKREIERAMLDGAATFVRLLHQSQADSGHGTSSSMPIAEELVAMGQQEPAMGNLLVAMSGKYMIRYHLQRQHRDVVAMVERTLTH